MAIERTIRIFNDRYCQLTGYSSEEIIGRSARMLYPTQEDYEYVGSELYQKMHAQGTVKTRMRKKDGTIINILFATTPIDPSNLPVGVIFTAQEISDRDATPGT